jgi:hypothetical protein
MIDQPRRIMLRKKWFPVSSRRSPPSSLIPKLGRWPRQSLVQSNFSTRKRVPDPTQSLMDGLDSSSWTTDTTSSALWMFCSQPTRREIIPQAWSQLRRWFQRKDTINKVFWRNFGKNSWNNKLKTFYLVWPRVPIRQCVWLFRRLQNAAVLNRPWHINKLRNVKTYWFFASRTVLSALCWSRLQLSISSQWLFLYLWFIHIWVQIAPKKGK